MADEANKPNTGLGGGIVIGGDVPESNMTVQRHDYLPNDLVLKPIQNAKLE